MKMMFGAVESVCDRMVEYLKPMAEKSASIEMKEVLASFTTEGASDSKQLRISI
jgi:hypothetical protein